VGSGLIFMPASLWLGFSGIGDGHSASRDLRGSNPPSSTTFLRPLLLVGAPSSAACDFHQRGWRLGLFGMLGLVLGPILVATAAGVLAVYMERRKARP